MTVVAASGAQNFNGTVRVSATDTLSTTSRAFNLHLSGAVTATPNQNYLTIDPGGATSPSTSPSINTVLYTLNNTGPDDIQASMQTPNDIAAIGLTFDYVDLIVPAQVGMTPGAATTTLTIDIPAGLSPYGTPIQISAEAGANTAQAGLYLA